MHRPFRISYAALCTFVVLNVCSCASSSTDNRPRVSSKFDWSTKLESVGLSEAEFTECMAQIINESGTLKARVAGPLWLRVSGHGKDKEGSIYLVNAWKTSKDSPGERRKSLKPFIASWTDQSNAALLDAKAALTDIVPVIRSTDYNKGIVEEMNAYTEPFVSDLVVLYGIDTPKTVSYMLPERVRALKLEPTQLRKLAVENLLRKIPEQKIKHGENFSMLIAGGDYEASFLLIDDFWKDMQKRIGKRIVVGVPSKDIVIFAADNNKDGIGQIRKFTTKGFKEFSYPISDKLLLYDGKWQAY
jgi:hypothetical protein